MPTLPQLERVEAVNGYVNFYVDKNWYANRVVGQVLSQGGEYGCWPRKDERVMVEYANVNTHKTMHVGHLRNVALGAATVNILRCYGYDTVSATYIGAAVPAALLGALYAFEVLVSVLQAFIFTMLAAVYIGGAMRPEHG